MMRAFSRWLRAAVFLSLALALALALALVLADSSGFAQQRSARYVNQDLATGISGFQAQLKKAGQPYLGRSFAQNASEALAKMKMGDNAGALPLLAAAITNSPDTSSLWLNYSWAVMGAAKTDNNNNRNELHREALLAAYAGYKASDSLQDQALALSTLSKAYASDESWRQAITAAKASLDLRETGDVRAAYIDLRSKYGFRIKDYDIKNDVVTPSVCFNLSEYLAPGNIDFAPYVTVSGQSNAAVSAVDRQLCVEGLKHGEHYNIIVRKGLPSAVGEDLLANADYDIYIRDRPPGVRFTGSNYVLPSAGQEGIPLVSVNAPLISVEILRIGDRNLLSSIHSEEFLTQLPSYRFGELKQSGAVKIWSGSLKPAYQLNQDVTTAFPVLDAVGKLQPGVYVMAAQLGNESATAIKVDEDYNETSMSTQWFVVSDLGLTGLSAPDGLHVLLRSLASAKPLSGVEVRLLSKSNEVLATTKSDSAGYVHFDPGLTRGTDGMAPAAIVAVGENGDYNFLDINAQPFDLTDRGVWGDEVVAGLSALVYAERGVYRAGENVFLTTILRDAQGQAVSGLPLTLTIQRPDEVEFRRVVVADQLLGGRGYKLNLPDNAVSGTWKVKVFSDPKGRAIGETTFLIADYVPERIELSLKAQQALSHPGDVIDIDLDARYLYGAPASGLEVSGIISVGLGVDETEPASLQGYEFGLAGEGVEAVRADVGGDDAITTDEKGHATLHITVPDTPAIRRLKADITLSVAETGGRAVERSLSLPILPRTSVIGLKSKVVDDDSKSKPHVEFDALVVDMQGKSIARKNLQWTFYRVTNHYQWFHSSGRWGFETVKNSSKIADGTIDVKAGQPTHLSMPVDYGTYRLEMRTADGSVAMTTIDVHVGWTGEPSAQTPDLLNVTIEKAEYEVGDELKMHINSHFAGTGTIAIITDDKVDTLQIVDLNQGETVVSVPVKAEWGGGAYAVAFAHRPLDQAAKRMPGRALGLAWFAIAPKSHQLDMVLGAPEKMRPNGTLSLPVKLTGFAPGEEAAVAVSAVDVGIINLTDYESPDIFDYFFGKKRMSTEIRDIYGLLIDGMSGTRGEIRSGGDASAALGSRPKPTQAPLAFYSGVVKVGADGIANIAFEIPAFNGTVRVAAIGWSKTRVGAKQADVIIRDPVVVSASLPRFLILGDQSRLHLMIDNVEGRPGDYVIDLDVHGPVNLEASALHKTVSLPAGGKSELIIPITSAGIGQATLDLRISGQGLNTTQHFTLSSMAGSGDLYARTVRQLAPGEKMTVSEQLLSELVPGSGSVSLAVSPIVTTDVPALLQLLDRYPYGCSEQLTSRVLPLLYANKLAAAEALKVDEQLAQRIRDTIDRLMARQGSSGYFGLWSSSSNEDEGGEDLWLSAYVMDFLTRARENNFIVQQRAFSNGLDYLRNQVTNKNDFDETQASGIAYALYVLARNGRSVIGDLRYVSDARLKTFVTALSRAQLAASFALLGDQVRAASIFTTAVDVLEESSRQTIHARSDYGSVLRDSAALLALSVEVNAARADVLRVAKVYESARAQRFYPSTQEASWMVLAAMAQMNQTNAIKFDIDGQSHQGALFRNIPESTLMTHPVNLTNNSSDTLRLVVTTSGLPATPEPEVQKGYRVERDFYKMDASKIDLLHIRQTDRLVVAVTVTELEARSAKLLLEDRLPAGFEIENPDLVDADQMTSLSFLKSDIKPIHTEYRDDRFTAAFERFDGEQQSFTIAYIVRAVTPGHYVYPPARIEDMYNPERFGRTGFGALDVSSVK